MFTNILKTALRNLLRYKGYSAVSVFGLAVGMACCIFLLMYIQHELSFDTNQKNADRIFRLVMERKAPEGSSMDVTSPPPLAQAIQNDLTHIAQTVRFQSIDNPIPLVRFGETRSYERQFVFADPGVFALFSIPFIAGDEKSALIKPNTVVLTNETARRYFGNQDPLGKTILLNNNVALEVTGVVENPPSNSTLQYDFLASFATLTSWLGKDYVDNWQNNSCQTYLLLSDKVSPQDVEQQFLPLIPMYMAKGNVVQQVHLQPLKRIHLYSTVDYGLQSVGDIHTVYTLAAIALLVMLIAIINYIDLTTARFLLRSKEVGVRKLIGATRFQLAYQFIVEAFITTLLALIVGAAVVEFAIPYFGAEFGIDLTQYYGHNGQHWLMPVGVVLIVSVLADLYPAIFFSSLQPGRAIVSTMTTGRRRATSRRILVVFQFALLCILLVGTLVVRNQMEFVHNKQIGLNKDQVIVIPIRNELIRQNPQTVKSRLLQQSGVEAVGAAALLPAGPVGRTRFIAEGMSQSGTMSMLWVDEDFLKTLGITVVAGRDFSKEILSDASEGFVVNEEAVRELGWSSPQDAIGKKFELTGGKKGTIIGVAKDFNFTSLHRKIGPLVVHIWPWMNYIVVRADVSRLPGILVGLKQVWHDFDPNNPFTYSFLSDNFDKLYRSDLQLGRIFSFFASLAILIACLGLLSLAAFTTQQRTKEIGIRKVLGASVARIVGMLTKEIVGLIVVANVVAWPIAYYVMRLWLRGFAYQVEWGWTVFAVVGAASIGLAFVAVSYQAVKSALANPVEALRYE